MRKQTESIARLRSSLETARRDEEAQQARVRGLKEMEVMTDDLVSKKLAVKSRLLDVRDRLMEAERNTELARNRQIEIRRELSALEAEKAAYETGWRQKMLEEMLAVSRERDAVSDQLQKANLRQSRVILTAPADAVVLEVAKLSTGSIIKEAEPFFTLVPISNELEAEVQIDSLDIGYIKLGSKASVKVDAYPFQKHGILEGTLRTVSQDAFRREQGAAAGMDAYYTGRVAFGTSHLQELPPGGRSGKHRHLGDEAHFIIEGSGYEEIDGQRWDWEANDAVAIPNLSTHQSFNADPERPAKFLVYKSRTFEYGSFAGIEHLEDASPLA